MSEQEIYVGQVVQTCYRVGGRYWVGTVKSVDRSAGVAYVERFNGELFAEPLSRLGPFISEAGPLRRLSRRWWISEDANVMVRVEYATLIDPDDGGILSFRRYRASFQDGNGWKILRRRFDTVEAAEAAANQAWSEVWA